MKFNVYKFVKLLPLGTPCSQYDLAVVEYVWANHPSIIGSADEKMRQIAGLYVDFGARMMRHMAIGAAMAHGMRMFIEFVNQELNKHKKKVTYGPKINHHAFKIAELELEIEKNQKLLKELKEKEDVYIAQKQLVKLRSISVINSERK